MHCDFPQIDFVCLADSAHGGPQIGFRKNLWASLNLGGDHSEFTKLDEAGHMICRPGVCGGKDAVSPPASFAAPPGFFERTSIGAEADLNR
jgi:hypothetical protein